MAREPRAPTARACATDRIATALDRFVADPTDAEAFAARQRDALPDAAAIRIDAVLGKASKSYRDGLIIQLAYGLEDEAAAEDHTIRHEGGRGVAQDLGKLFAERHIAGVKDAYQNIGKNITKLDRGNEPEFDETIRWFNTVNRATREAAFGYILSRVSLTARAVLPLPEIDRGALTFYRLSRFMDALLAIPSGGAYQQFGVAACLHAVIEEFGQGGVGGLRVETKNLNASDASSRVAGDVQIIRGARVEEAFEVTANDWREKVAGAIASARSADLQRVHILATVDPGFLATAGELATAGAELTVIDVAFYLRTVIAVMRKPARAAALVRLYEFLDRYQPDVERTNRFVALLREHGFAVGV